MTPLPCAAAAAAAAPRLGCHRHRTAGSRAGGPAEGRAARWPPRPPPRAGSRLQGRSKQRGGLSMPPARASVPGQACAAPSAPTNYEEGGRHLGTVLAQQHKRVFLQCMPRQCMPRQAGECSRRSAEVHCGTGLSACHRNSPCSAPVLAHGPALAPPAPLGGFAPGKSRGTETLRACGSGCCGTGPAGRSTQGQLGRWRQAGWLAQARQHDASHACAACPPPSAGPAHLQHRALAQRAVKQGAIVSVAPRRELLLGEPLRQACQQAGVAQPEAGAQPAQLLPAGRLVSACRQGREHGCVWVR